MGDCSLTAALKEEARRLGFELVGACPAVQSPGIGRFQQWLAAGYAGEMRYLADRADAYRHPASILDGVQSILMLGKVYRSADPGEASPGHGRVSRYAWGRDYHDLIHDRLRELAAFHRRLTPGVSVRGVVDSAPLLEREFAQLAGLGWIGKNTLLLNCRLGSWFFLAALLTSEVLHYDEPFAAGHCGTCRACIDACPTGALIEPYTLDARKCISYLTIELRGAAPAEMRPAMREWLFGCDICQEVCPWNGRAPRTSEPELQPAAGMNPVALAELFSLDDAGFRQRFRHSPLWRAKRRGLLRNAAIVLGNMPHAAAIGSLIHGLNDTEPLVRSSCAWALGRWDDPAARRALGDRAAIETDAAVQQEIEAALHRR
ncbi:MAG: tRNA epoxyqueuosine(34) reductase QueG [Thermoguttaceae bacterium]